MKKVDPKFSYYMEIRWPSVYDEFLEYAQKNGFEYQIGPGFFCHIIIVSSQTRSFEIYRYSGTEVVNLFLTDAPYDFALHHSRKRPKWNIELNLENFEEHLLAAKRWLLENGQ